MMTPEHHVRIALMHVRLGALDLAKIRIQNAICEANRTSAPAKAKASLFRMMNWLRADLMRAKP